MSRRIDEDRLERLLEGDVDESAESRDLLGFLELSKRSLEDTSDWSAEREQALVERVLTRTTREDLSVRGELRLVGRFLRDRLRSSAALRILAASVLLHLCIVPVLGMLAWKERTAPRTRIEFELPRTDEDAAFADPVEDEADPARTVRHTALEHENARRRARWVLATSSGPPIPTNDGSLESKLLAARSRYLAERAWTPWLDERATWQDGTTLARVLLAELLLDRFLFEAVRSPELDPLLYRLERDGPPPGALARLRTATLERARSEGLLDEEVPEAESPLALRRSLVLPLSAAWCADLVEACGGLPSAAAAEAFAARRP